MDKLSSCSPALALAFALAIAPVACEASSIRSADVPRQEPVSAASSARHAPENPGDSALGNAIEWNDWDAALRTAKAENKSLCVLVYTDWCPRCKELAPEFAKPEVMRAAQGLVMVRQNQDKSAPWLKERLGKY